MTANIIKQFNEILESFLNQMIPLLGESYHRKFKMIIKMNSTIGIEKFLTYALPHRDKILSRDESYFAESDATKLEEDAKTNEDLLNEILKMQHIFVKLDDNSKSNVWDIFQAMLILGEDYLKATYSNKK